MKHSYQYETPIGTIGIIENGQAVIRICFIENVLEKESEWKEASKKETPLLKNAAVQLKEYLRGERKEFDFPIALEGTQFQKSVWEALRNIPYGETRTYKQIAEQIGNPRGSQAVGQANRNNPVAIVVPCHRVIGSNRKLVGYAGGLDRKQRLLDIEREHFI